jgi:hypothetical protein
MNSGSVLQICSTSSAKSTGKLITRFTERDSGIRLGPSPSRHTHSTPKNGFRNPLFIGKNRPASDSSNSPLSCDAQLEAEPIINSPAEPRKPDRHRTAVRCRRCKCMSKLRLRQQGLCGNHPNIAQTSDARISHSRYANLLLHVISAIKVFNTDPNQDLNSDKICASKKLISH